MKRILSLILVTLCLTFGLLAVDAQAAGVLASGACGADLTWTLTDDGLLTISGTGAMDSSYKASWDAVKNEIITVKMDDTVTQLSNYKPADGVVKNNIEATCTDDGSYDLVVCCSACGEEQSRTNVIVHAVGHKFVNHVSDGNATTTQDGTKTAKCENCDATDIVIDEGTKIRHGWVSESGKWYYYSEGQMLVSRWVSSGGKWYYLGQNGAMATGWLSVNGRWYYLANTGAVSTGWVKVGNNWYYMNESGVMQTGTQVINGKTYKFSSGGVWVG